MQEHGVIYSDDKVVKSYKLNDELFITTSDHFRLIASYRERIAELTKKTSEKVTLIGLSGLAGAGKSTAAKILVEDHGFVRLRFADTIKEMLATLLRQADFDEATIKEAIDGDLKEEGFAVLNWKTPRYCLQTLGTEWGRWGVGENLWANITKKAIERELRAGRKVVVDDVRFQNEIDVIGELGGDVHRVLKAEQELAVTGHASETQALQGQKILKNTGTIADLETAILNIV